MRVRVKALVYIPPQVRVIHGHPLIQGCSQGLQGWGGQGGGHGRGRLGGGQTATLTKLLRHDSELPHGMVKFRGPDPDLDERLQFFLHRGLHEHLDLRLRLDLHGGAQGGPH